MRRERLYAYIQLIHFMVQQKLTQHCTAIIFQFKNMFSLGIYGKLQSGKY